METVLFWMVALEIGAVAACITAIAQFEIRRRSSKRSAAISPKGAIGVLQVMPHVAWEEYEVSAEKLFDPDVNIRVGLTVMKSLLQRFDQNVDLSLAAYNAGPSKVVEAGYRVPPIKQTQEYVKRVKETMNEYGPIYYHD